MIKINVFKVDSYILKIIIKGHANFDEYGKDIVCAGVSAVTIGMINAITSLKKDEFTFIQNENEFILNFSKDKEVQLLASSLLIQLQSIQESYSKNVEIKYQ